jgi:hypothetical protein
MTLSRLASIAHTDINQAIQLDLIGIAVAF